MDWVKFQALSLHYSSNLQHEGKTREIHWGGGESPGSLL